jgi:phage-related protein
MGAIQLFLAIIKALPTIIIALVNALPTIIENVVKTLTSTQFINMMINASIQLFLAIVKAVPSVLGSIGGAIGRILGVIGDTLSPGNLARIGGDLIKGLWNGISNITGWLMDKIKGFGSAVMDGIKGIFGIHSPSTEWAWVGKMNIMGLAKGITDNAGLVNKAVDSVTGDLMSGLSINPNLTASALATPYTDAPAGAVASGAGVVQNNNIYNQVDLDSVSRELAWQIRR